MLVVGDVINDVLVRPMGEITADSDTRAQIVRRPGGSAANLACWLGSLGREVTFVGRVGTGDQGYHASFFARFGVEAHLVVDPELETGTIVVLVDAGGGRTMLTDRGANLRLAVEDVPAALLHRAAALHLSGYSFFEDGVRATARTLLARARRAGTPVSIDPSSSAFLEEVGPDRFLAWTAGADLVFPNRDEAAVLAGTADPLLAAERLATHYGTVVVTLDGDGCVVAHGGRSPVLVPAERVRPVDTTGAGDAFCAGFLDRWLDDADPVAAAGAGARVARSAVARMGARPLPDDGAGGRAPGPSPATS